MVKALTISAVICGLIAALSGSVVALLVTIGFVIGIVMIERNDTDL